YTGKGDEVFAAWKAGVTELARCENVTMKLGGMTMRLAAYDYGARAAPPSSQELADLWRPYIELCVERFGPARCMFESNFPVEKMGIGYAALWNVFKRIAAGASPADNLALFSGTARRAYRLSGAPARPAPRRDAPRRFRKALARLPALWGEAGEIDGSASARGASTGWRP